MFVPKYPPRDDPSVERTTKFLIEFFPDLPAHRARFHAVALVHSLEWSKALFQAGKSDRVASEQFVVALKKAKIAVSKLSIWTQGAIETELYRFCSDESEDEANPDAPMPPATISDIEFHFDVLINAACKAELMRASVAPSHGKNARAMVLIDEARMTWEAITRKPAPPKALNIDPNSSRFRQFLEGVFNSVQLYCDLTNAYENWAKNAHDPAGQFEKPRSP